MTSLFTPYMLPVVLFQNLKSIWYQGSTDIENKGQNMEMKTWLSFLTISTKVISKALWYYSISIIILKLYESNIAKSQHTKYWYCIETVLKIFIEFST